MADDKIVWELDLDEESYRRAVNRMISDSDRLDSQFDDLAAGAKKIDKAVSAIDGDVRVDVSVNDTDLRDAKRKKEDLTGSERVSVNVNDQDLKDALDDINFLKNIQVITLTLNVLQNVKDFDPTQIPIVGTINELDMAVGRLTATTGREIPDAANIIRSVYNGAWGESYDEVGRVVAQLDAAGVSTDDLATQAANALDTVNLTGEDTQRIIQVASRLVSSGLANSFTEAFDIINRGYQLTNGRADDLLDTLNEYSPLIADAGFSADEFLTTLNQGLEAGAFNTDKVADAVKEFGLRGQQAFVGADENFTNALDALGINISDYEGAGADLLQAVVDGMTAKLASGELTTVDIQALVPNLFGSPGEDVGVSVLLSFDLDQESVDAVVGQMDGVTQTVSQNLNDNLGTAWEQFTRTAESELTIALDNAFDISGKIDAAKEAVTTFANELNSGATFGHALEVALSLPGLEEQLNRLASVIGNLGIEILGAVGSVTSLVNQDLSNQIFDEVARLSAGQLEFDLGVSVDEQDVETALRTAIRRGVSDQTIEDTVTTAVVDRFDNAGYEAGQAFTTSVTQAIGEINDIEMPDPGQAMQAGRLPDLLEVDTATLQGQAQVYTDQLFGFIDDAIALGDYDTAAALAENVFSGDPEGLSIFLGDLETLLDKSGVAQTSLNALSGKTSETIDAMSRQFQGATKDIFNTSTEFQNLNETVATSTGDIGVHAGNMASTIEREGDRVRVVLWELMEYTGNLALAWGAMGINPGVTGTQVNGINGMQAGAGAGNTTNSTNTTNNVNMTVNTQSNAQATQFADTALRGF